MAFLKKAPILVTLMVLLWSCDGDEERQEIIPDIAFSATEMAVLDQYLNLAPRPFNYAQPLLPENFYEEDSEELDNNPAHNPVTNLGATLGRVLFYDTKLSIDNTISCASCHQQDAAFSDPRRFSVGLQGQTTRRNSMTLINSRYYQNGRFFWDERAASLEQQALIPIQDHIEMGMELKQLEEKLQQLPYYEILFEKAFGDKQVSAQRIGKALAQFMRPMVSFNSKFDRGLELADFPEVGEGMDDLPNFTAQERLGMDIFMNGRKGATCQYCHGTAHNVAFEARNNGLELHYNDRGKGEITGRSSDEALFKAPSLRNIAKTAPYMHDGRFATLREVVDHYSDRVKQHRNLHFRLSTIDDGPLGSPPMRLNLNESEKEALIAFLHTLTDEVILEDEKFSDPFK